MRRSPAHYPSPALPACWALSSRRGRLGRLVRAMASYKYVLVCLMLVLFLYSLSIDVTYPYDHNIFSRELVYPHRLTSKEEKVEKETGNKTHHCHVYAMSPDYKANFECVQTRTRPAATVCLHDVLSDMYISHDLRETGLWEPHVVSEFLEALRQDEALGVIDVGANIGFYSLLAAAMGRRVVAVEPALENIYRLHRAAALANVTSSVTVLHNAVSDTRGRGRVVGSGDNQGDTRVREGAEPCVGSCLPTVELILLEDLLEVAAFRRAVVKLDIQGYEHRALRHAGPLLDRIAVPLIFMEWTLMRHFRNTTLQQDNDRDLVERMLRDLFRRDYRPYALSKRGGAPLDPERWGVWPDDIVWRKLPDEEQVEGAMRNHFMNWP